MKEIRAMFSEQWVRENMISAKEYHPYPKPDERDFWNGLAPELQSHLLQKGEEFLDYEWKGLPATVFLEYRRTGNRYCYEELSFAKRMALGSLMMAECVAIKKNRTDILCQLVFHGAVFCGNYAL